MNHNETTDDIVAVLKELGVDVSDEGRALRLSKLLKSVSDKTHTAVTDCLDERMTEMENRVAAFAKNEGLEDQRNSIHGAYLYMTLCNLLELAAFHSAVLRESPSKFVGHAMRHWEMEAQNVALDRAAETIGGALDTIMKSKLEKAAKSHSSDN